ncbi:MAG: DUF6427 family protein [Sphingobacteriaceae bacterium]|jgi:hypothetical protein|nr:MAG: beta-carotene 15,15'-monooxygenase [Pedobacter sp.]
MVKQFRTLSQTSLIPLIIIAVLLRLDVFIQRPNQLDFDFVEPFVKLLIPVPLEHLLSSGINMLIALVLTIIQALLMNKIVNMHNVIGKPTSLPALLFVTLSSLFPQFVILSPALICNFLVIWIISKVLELYQSPKVRFILFDMGMIIAVGTLIYFPFIAMLPLLWVSLIIFRPFVWREWIMGAIGFLVIFFFLGMFYFWNNSLGLFYQIWRPLASNFSANFHIHPYSYFVLIPVAIIVLLALVHMQKIFFRSPIQVRKAFQVFVFLFLFAFLSFYMKSRFHIYHFLLCVPSVSILAAYFFLHEKRRWLYESLYLFLVGSIILLQLF